MNKHLLAWALVAKSLKQQIPVMLLYVLESKGSSPGRQGFFMAVNAKNQMEGSIGGGMMEHKFVEMAKERLKSDRVDKEQEVSVRKQIHDKSVAKDQSGMICSGEQTIFMYHVPQQNEESVQKIIVTLQEKRNATLRLSPEGIELLATNSERDFNFSMKSDQNWFYEEKIGYKNQLFIIGGGHCALAFSKLMGDMDFYIRVYDERENLKTMLENGAAHERHFINNYSELNNLIPSGSNHYVVIMTFGYRSDDIALRALLPKEFKYLGLLGSKSKIDKMLEDYRNEGIAENFLQRIHTPVGIAIKSQTPEEIAVSIAAEIIQTKNKHLP